MMTRREALTAGAALIVPSLGAESKPKRDGQVRLERLPEGGIQSQVVAHKKGLHVIYYAGDAHNGDLFYARSTDGGKTFSRSLAVNSPGSAIAAGTIRGAQMALGAGGKIHVAWNGSANAVLKGPVNPDAGKPGAPMLYSRFNDAGTAFETRAESHAPFFWS
jgi:hypothetical protein